MHTRHPYRPKHSAALTFVTSLLVAPLCLGANEQQRLQQIQQDITELRSDLSSSKEKQNRIQGELRKLEKEIARVSRQLRNTQEKLKQQRTTQKTLQKETRELSSKLVKQKDLLGQQMLAGYSAGQQQALKLLLNQTNPAETGRTLAYYGYFTQAQFRTVQETQINIQQLNTATEKLKASTVRLEVLNKDQQTQKKAFDENKASRNQVLAQLNKDILNKEQRLEKLKADEQALAQVIHELSFKALPKYTNLRELKGKLSLPAQGRIRHNYGESRNLGEMRWKGILIGGQEGQDIRAIAPGEVVFADWIRGYGLMVIIDHGEGYMSLYGHNQSLYKDVGDKVSPNETIATLGSSGGNSETGLYFELRHKGKPINPQNWFK